MKKISTSKAFARLVLATNAGAIRWPRPLTDEQRAELAEIAARGPRLSGYQQHLASGNDFLSRFTKAQAEANKTDDDETKED